MIHDSEITSYEVDLKNHKIKIHANYDCREVKKRTEIVFSGVMAHCFEDELSGSIILDIEECGLDGFIKNNSKLLEKRKNYGWPTDYKTVDELMEILSRGGYRCYVIYASYGLNGWVLAKNYEEKQAD